VIRRGNEPQKAQKEILLCLLWLNPPLKSATHVRMSQARRRLYKYYDLLMASFVTILLCSNLIGAAKVCTVWGSHLGRESCSFRSATFSGAILTEVSPVLANLFLHYAFDHWMRRNHLDIPFER
jgi:hypothetical protein